MCADGVLTASEGKLDQSGHTYLPTTMWSCDTCGCVRYDAANSARWQSERSREAAAAAPGALKRAA
jgi:hypothetical protein